MFILQMLTVISLTVIFLASVEGRTQLYFLYVYVCVCCMDCMHPAVGQCRKGNDGEDRKGKKRKRGIAAGMETWM